MPAATQADHTGIVAALGAHVCRAVRSGACTLLLLASCVVPPAAVPESGAPDVSAARPPARWTGRGPGELYAPGEVRAFELRQREVVVARSWGRYVGPEPLGDRTVHRFETRIELVRGPGAPAVAGPDAASDTTSAPLRSSGELLVDERGRLVRGLERSDAAELTYAVDGQVVVRQAGPARDELLYDPDRTDTAFMAQGAFLHLELALGLRDVAPGTLEFRLLSLSGGTPTPWEAEVRALDEPGDPPRALRLRTNLGETITFADGRLLELRVEDDGLLLTPAPELGWPQWQVRGPDTLRYEPAYGPNVEVRAVELPGGARDATMIAGELLIPPGSRPRPAAVVLAGASAQDRYGFAGPPPVDLGTHAITDALVRAGFVVLRYDEPGTGGSAPREPSFALQVEDARRALRLLSVQDEVDPDRLVIVGHGEGGWRAMIVARELGPAVRGVALIGTPGRSFEAVYRERSAGVLAQVEPTLRERVAKQQAATLAALRDGGDVPDELLRQARWIREAFAIDPAQLAASAGAPLWIGAGEADFEIDPARDVDALAQAARKAGLRVTVARFPALDHLLKPEPGRSTPERYRVPRDVDLKALEALTTWCAAQANAKPQGKAGAKSKPASRP